MLQKTSQHWINLQIRSFQSNSQNKQCTSGIQDKTLNLLSSNPGPTGYECHCFGQMKLQKTSKYWKNLGIRNYQTDSQNKPCTLGVQGKTLKPFEAIPGPPGSGWPFFGHMKLLYQKPAGFARSWINLKHMKEKYCDENNEKLLRMNLPLFNPKNGRAVMLMDPIDVEEVYRHEGKFPIR